MLDWNEPSIAFYRALGARPRDEWTVQRVDGQALVRLAGGIRNLSGMDLEEGVSTRLLIYAATMIAKGMPVDRALQAAIIEPLSDAPDVQQALRDIASAVFG